MHAGEWPDRRRGRRLVSRAYFSPLLLCTPVGLDKFQARIRPLLLPSTGLYLVAMAAQSIEELHVVSANNMSDDYDDILFQDDYRDNHDSPVVAPLFIHGVSVYQSVLFVVGIVGNLLVVSGRRRY